jgi:hypothetical protein
MDVFTVVGVVIAFVLVIAIVGMAGWAAGRKPPS